jgi:hypothetical protein
VSFWQRFFEPLPHNWQTLYKPGEKVRLIREDPLSFVPLGAKGIFMEVLRGDSVMATKGRPYGIEFDLTPFGIKWGERLPLPLCRELGIPPESIVQSTTAYFGPNDLECQDRTSKGSFAIYVNERDELLR